MEDFFAPVQRKRVSRIIPFGWEVSKDDPWLLEPIPEQLEALRQAVKFLATCSLRQTAAWLTRKTGRYISHPGLEHIYKSYKAFKNKQYNGNRRIGPPRVKKVQLRPAKAKAREEAAKDAGTDSPPKTKAGGMEAEEARAEA